MEIISINHFKSLSQWFHRQHWSEKTILLAEFQLKTLHCCQRCTSTDFLELPSMAIYQTSHGWERWCTVNKVYCAAWKDFYWLEFWGLLYFLSACCSNVYSSVILKYSKATNTYKYTPAEEKKCPLHLQAIWFNLSSAATLHLHLNQQSQQPNARNLWPTCHSATALQRRQTVETFHTSLCSRLELAFKLDELCNSASPSRGPNANFALQLSQNLLPFSLLFSPRSR